MKLFLALTLAILAEPAHRPTRENFEGPEPSWRMADSDCGARLTRQKRSFEKPHGGQSSEQLQFVAGRGSYAYLTHEVEPSRVIDELVPRIWFRSNRAGAQILARVVLPRTESPRDGRPLSILIHGGSYSDVGGWQQLSIDDTALQVRRQEPVLRTKYGSKVDVREAYLDLVVLNAYAGPGTVDAWIDDLELAGHVAGPKADPRQARSVAYDETESASAEPREEDRVHLRGSVLVAGGRPLLVRGIEHQGEAFSWLQGLGFNTVELRDPPTAEQLAEARRIGLWLVSPPPHYDGRQQFDPAYDRVLAWDLGRGLTRRELEERRRAADEVRISDAGFKRPILVSAESQLASYSRLADVLRFERAPLGSTLELADYGPWLRDRARLARPGTPFWAVVQTEPSLKTAEQLAAYGFRPPTPLSVEPDQIRLLAWHAVAAGARGVCFASRNRLDANEPVTQARATALRLINRELMIVEPWGAGGSFDREVETSDPLARVSVLQTERSRLLMVMRHVAGQQYVVGPAGKESVSFVDPGASSSPQAYQVTSVGVAPIRNRRRDAGGLRLTLEDVPLTALAVLTQDPLVVNHLARQPTLPRGSLGRLHYETAARALTSVENIDRLLAEQSHPLATATALLAEARSNLKQSERFVGAEDDAAAQLFAGRAQRALAKIRRGHWEQAAAGLPSPVTSPFCTNFETLPGLWLTAQRLRAGRWTGNLLAGGEMENLSLLLDAKWKYERHPESTLAATVDLAPVAARSGQNGLRIRAAGSDERKAPGVVETPPIRISSGPIAVQAGQVVRISGWAKLPKPLEGTRDGLLIIDSLGGEPLAQRIQKAGDWQEFTLDRAALRSGDVTFSFVLTGLGEAWIDDVTVTVMEGPGG